MRGHAAVAGGEHRGVELAPPVKGRDADEVDALLHRCPTASPHPAGDQPVRATGLDHVGSSEEAAALRGDQVEGVVNRIHGPQNSTPGVTPDTCAELSTVPVERSAQNEVSQARGRGVGRRRTSRWGG